LIRINREDAKSAKAREEVSLKKQEFVGLYGLYYKMAEICVMAGAGSEFSLQAAPARGQAKA
jgi:hypothetical protein